MASKLPLLFTTPHCTKCPAFKAVLASRGIAYEELTPECPEFIPLARQYGITAVPALLRAGTVLHDASQL